MTEAEGNRFSPAGEGAEPARQQGETSPAQPSAEASEGKYARHPLLAWLLELWLRAPTPAKAARLRVSAVERLLKQHRIRRVNAEGILRTLREPAIKVPDGVVAAAGIHIRSLIVRLQVVNRELYDAERKLDELCSASVIHPRRHNILGYRMQRDKA